MAHELNWNGDEVRAQMRGLSAAGLTMALEHLLQVSREEAPIQEGDLAGSGVASVDEDQLVGAVSYDRPYALRQHEELTWRHDEGKKAKYLEDPFNNERDTMLELIAAAVRRGL